jgi:hypothetical protein
MHSPNSQREHSVQASGHPGIDSGQGFGRQDTGHIRGHSNGHAQRNITAQIMNRSMATGTAGATDSGTP